MYGKTILIVDDSPLIIERLGLMMKELGSVDFFRSAADHTSALRLFAEFHFDIVLLDINLPGKSGIELLQHIKATRPSTIVIMVTNQPGEYYRSLCKKLGANHFMDKSQDFELIPVIISSLL